MTSLEAKKVGSERALWLEDGRHTCHPFNSLPKETFQSCVYCNEKEHGSDLISVKETSFLLLGLNLPSQQEALVP